MDKRKSETDCQRSEAQRSLSVRRTHDDEEEHSRQYELG
jgi:hypothetical protein